MTTTDEPQPIETVHDTSLDGIEREPNFDIPAKAQVDELVITGVKA